MNTLHLFDETLDFVEEMEEFYGVKTYTTMAKGVQGDRQQSKEMFDDLYGADLWKYDISKYDEVCKVEPFRRGLSDLNAEIMITGRTRWQGAERAWLDVFEAPKKKGGLGNCNPIVDWSLEDVFNYIQYYKIPYHPLHAKGYPSIGDAKDTVPIPNDGSVWFCNETYQFVGDKTQWLGYGLERQGRFVGLPVTKDGKTKTECGIHVDGEDKESERDLWISESII